VRSIDVHKTPRVTAEGDSEWDLAVVPFPPFSL
jgi:hypothetical protein